MPQDIPKYTGNVILTTAQESTSLSPSYNNNTRCSIPIILDTVFDQHPTIILGTLIKKLKINALNSSTLILGVDPGLRLGLSVFYHNKEIESSVYSSLNDLVSHMITILGGLHAKHKIVKIGNGDIKIAQEIATKLNLGYCSSFQLHFVDEKYTSPKIKNYNQRGKRDMLSARFISKRDGGFSKFMLPLSMTG